MQDNLFVNYIHTFNIIIRRTQVECSFSFNNQHVEETAIYFLKYIKFTFSFPAEPLLLLSKWGRPPQAG